MNFASSVNSFDFFASCYIYGCLTYISALFLIHVYCSLLADYRVEYQPIRVIKPDFYTQVKDLLDPAEKSSFKSLIETSQQVNFESMILRELPTHVRVRDRLDKTVSNTHKS